MQVGIKRVRVAAQLVPLMYVGYRLKDRVNSGPVEYIELYETMWPTFNTAGSQVRAPSAAPGSTPPRAIPCLCHVSMPAARVAGAAQAARAGIPPPRGPSVAPGGTRAA